MGKVGRFIVDAKAGSYSHIKLESGEKIVVNHDRPLLTIELLKLFGFSSERIFSCDTATPGGAAFLRAITVGAAPRTAEATPLGALVSYIKESPTAAEVKRQCDELLARCSQWPVPGPTREG